MPWYVGKATKTFLQECFTDRNLRKYDKVLVERKGTPILFLLARRTPGEGSERYYMIKRPEGWRIFLSTTA